MSSVSLLKIESLPPASKGLAPVTDYLGPADVVEASGGRLVVELPGGARVTATHALAPPYEAAIGDVLLVIGKGGNHYAIGVIHGKGKTALALHGDVELRAVEGVLSPSGDKGVEIRSPEVAVETGKLRLLGDAAVQKFSSLFQRVSGLLSVQAKESHTIVQEDSVTQAKRGVVLTEETMTINGKQIHLG